MPWPRPSAWPLQPEPFYPPPPPQIFFLGKLGGIRNPPGLDKQDSIWQDRKALRGQTDRTRHPTGTGSPPGRARKLRLPLGMTRSQGPSQGPSATASTSATRGQVAENGLRGHYKKSRLPQTSLHGQGRQDILKLFLRARQDLKTMTLGTWHGTSGRDVDWIHGARVSGDRRAWVSGDPAGLSQRRSGGHWVRGRPAGIESEAGRWAWGSSNLGTREPAGGLGIATAGGEYLPRSVGMRARGQRTRLPRETKHFSNTENKNEVKGRRLRLGLVFCHGAHSREEQGHTDEYVNSNSI